MIKRISRAGVLLMALLMALLLVLPMLTVSAQATTKKWTDVAVDESWYTANTTQPTYDISNQEKLAAVAKLVNEGTTDFKGKVLNISNNLDMSANKWVPIGTADNPFNGTLKGISTAICISGLQINNADPPADPPADPNTGFVRYLGASGKISSLTLKGSVTIDEAGTANIGGVCGYAVGGSSIASVNSQMSVTVTGTGNVNVGGILGAGSCELTQCINGARSTSEAFGDATIGAINVKANSANVGGIVGSVEAVTIKASVSEKETSNSANITVEAPTANVGGIAGCVPSGQTLTFTSAGETTNDDADYVWSLGEKMTVTSDTQANVGGYVGSVEGTATMDKPTFIREIEVQGTGAANVGGIVGSDSGNSITNATLTTNLKKLGVNDAIMINVAHLSPKITVTSTGAVCTGGIVGQATNTTITKACVGDTNPPEAAAKTAITSTGTVGGIVGSLSDGGKLTDSSVKYANIEKTSGEGESDDDNGNGNVGGAIGLNEAADVDATVKDITLTAKYATNVGGVIGSSTGTVDALTAENVKLTATNSTDTVGIGGVIGSSAAAVTTLTAKDVELTASALATQGSIGGVIGNSTGTVNTLTADTITMNTPDVHTVGGAIGNSTAAVTNLTIKNVTITTKPMTGGKVGGVIGYSTAAVDTLTADALSVTVDGATNVGGVIGYSGGTVGTLNANTTVDSAQITVTATNSANDANIGGVIGYSTAAVGTLTADALSVTVDGATNVGGVIGYSGGTVGTLNANTTVNSAQITVTATDSANNANVGGVIGTSTTEVTTLNANTTVNSAQISVTVTNLIGGNVGGVIGSNGTIGTLKINDVALDTIRVTATGLKNVNVGGVFGSNSQALSDENLKTMQNLTVNATGSGGFVGGVVGRNTGVFSSSYTNTTGNLKLSGVGVTANLPGGSVGGFAGKTTANLAGLAMTSITIKSGGTGTYIGGIAGEGNVIVADSYIHGLDLIIGGKNNFLGTQSVVGGAVGLNGENGTLQNVNLKGSITVGNALYPADSCVVGGAIGDNKGTLNNFSLGDALELKHQGGDSSVFGGLVGKNSGTLTFCYSSAALSANGGSTTAFTLGGLVGENSGAVSASYRDAAVTLYASEKTKTSCVGGLIGKNSGGTVTQCYVSAPVSAALTEATAYVGGLIGCMTGGSVANCYTCSEVRADSADTYVGGFIGAFSDGTITNSYSTAEVKYMSGTPAGGFFGRYDNSDSSKLTRCLYAAATNLKDSGGGTKTDLVKADALKNLKKETFADQTELKKAATGWDFTNVWRYGSGDAQAAYHYPELQRKTNDNAEYVNYDLRWCEEDNTEYCISTEAGLAGLAALVNGSVAGYLQDDFSGKTITLTGPIHLQSMQWVGISNGIGAEFNGTLDGANHLVSGLSMNNDTMAGLFGNLVGTVRNLILEPFAVKGAGKTAGLAAYHTGTITNVTVNLNGAATISGGQYVGGVAADSTGKIEKISVNLNNTATISGGAYVGGVVGNMTAAITGAAENPVTVTLNNETSISAGAANGYVGGIVGKMTAAITGAAVLVTLNNEASISASAANSYVGGIVGNTTAAITGAEGKPVTVTLNDAASISAGAANSYVGGIVGYTTKAISCAKVSGSMTGAVSICAAGTESYVGGIVGKSDSADDDSVKNAEVRLTGTTGTVSITVGTGTSYVGGIAGAVNKRITDVTVTLTGATVSISGGAYVGGVVGKSESDKDDSVKNAAVTLTGTAGAAKLSASEGNTYVGGVAGEANKYISEVSVTLSGIGASVSGGQYVGGIVGKSSSTVTNATVSMDGKTGAASVTGTVYVGGIAGQITGAISGTANKPMTVTLTGATVSISGTSNVGGVAGDTTGEITNAAVTLSGTADAEAVKLDASAAESHLGGVVGKTTAAITNVTVKLSGVGASVSGKQHVGVVAGEGISVTDATVSMDGKTGAASVTGTDYVGGIAGQITGAISGTANKPVTVTLIGATVSISGTTNVGGVAGDTAGEITNAAVTLSGTADAEAVKLDASAADSHLGGIAGKTAKAITNVTVKLSGVGASVSGGQYVGGVVGESSSTVTNATVSMDGKTGAASVIGTVYVGGIAGQITGAIGTADKPMTVTLIGATVSISGTTNVGGIAGDTTGLITNAAVSLTGTADADAAKLSASAAESHLGGIAGKTNKLISGVTVTLSGVGASVSGGQYVGGVVGEGTSVTGAALSMDGKTGAASVTASAAASYVGGVAGKITSTIGIADKPVTVTLIGATVSISGGAYVGGAVGFLSGNMTNTVVNLTNATLSATAANALLGGAVGNAQTGVLTKVRINLNNSAITATVGSFTGSLGGIVGQSAADHTIADATLTAVNSAEYTGANLSAAGGHVGGIVGTDAGASVGAASLDVSQVTVRGARISLTGAGDVGGVVGTASAAQYSGLTVETVNITTADGQNVNGGGVVGQATNCVVYHAAYSDGSLSVTTESGAYTANVGGAVGLLTVSENATTLYVIDTAKVYQGIHGVTVSGVTCSATGTGNTAAVNVGGLVGKNVGGSVYQCVVGDNDAKPSSIFKVSGYKNACVGGGVGSSTDATGYLIANSVKCGVTAEDCTVCRVGGMVGELANATVRYNDVQKAEFKLGKAISNGTPEIDVGGFVGVAGSSAAIAYNTTAIDVSVSCNNGDNGICAGGFAGITEDNAALLASYATGSVSVGGIGGSTAHKANVGGFVGAAAGTIESCYATGNVSGKASNVNCGGFAGLVTGTITDAYTRGTSVTAEGSVQQPLCGGFVGRNDGTIQSVYVTMDADGVTGKSLLYGQDNDDPKMKYAYTKANDLTVFGNLTGMDFKATWAYLSGQNNGYPVLTAINGWNMRPDLALVNKVLVDGYYEIGTVEELGAVNSMLNDPDFCTLFSDGRAALPANLKVKLTASLSLAGKVWTPIGTLRAGDVFDGGGKTVSYLGRDAGCTKTNYGFVSVNEGAIQNLTLSNATVTAGSASGLVCGKNSGTIGNVTVTNSTLKGSGYVGAVCGINDAEKQISNARVTETVSVTASNVGGVVGQNNGVVENAVVATTDARLNGTLGVGGVAAQNAAGATVTTSALWGSLNVASASGSVRILGGIVGENKGAVTQCYDQANLSFVMTEAANSDAAYVGGIVGLNSGTVSDCFTASGAVVRANAQTAKSITEAVGGIAGTSSGGSITSCMNLAQVFVSKNAVYKQGQTFFGAIVGWLTNTATTLTNNVFDRQYTGCAIAYYDAQKAPVRNPNDEHVKAYYTNGLTTAALPNGLNGATWTAAAGRFPILTHLVADAQALQCVQMSGVVGGQAYSERCAAPTGLAPQYFPEETTLTVALVCATEGAEIYYTIDGSTPDETQTKYSAPISVTATTTVRAIAIKPHCADSAVVAAGYIKGTPPPSSAQDEPVPEKTVVVVDGVEYDFGASATENGVTTVTPDTKKLNAQIASAAAGSTVVVQIEKQADADTTAACLSLQSIETMAQKTMTPSIQAGGVSYEMPAAAIDPKAILTELKAEDVAQVSLSIAIKELPSTEVTLSSGALVGNPIQFSVTAACNGKTTEIKSFKSYVRRVIELTGEQAAQVTTAVVLENGVQRHVPTKIYQKDGKWYAEISSLTNSVYALISDRVSFTDVAGKWFAPMVTELAGRGVISGREKGLFEGEDGITRAEFTAILVKALGLPTDGDPSALTDVPRGAWYYGVVGKAYEYGLVSGDEQKRFTPEVNLTRQEAMVIVRGAAALTGFAGTSGTLEQFSDADSIDPWAIDAARWNVGSGLIQGDEANRLCGQDRITRGEAATIILRLLQRSGLVDERS